MDKIVVILAEVFLDAILGEGPSLWVDDGYTDDDGNFVQTLQEVGLDGTFDFLKGAEAAIAALVAIGWTPPAAVTP